MGVILKKVALVMKVIISENKLVFIGKGKDITKQLKHYSAQYKLVTDWINNYKN